MTGTALPVLTTWAMSTEAMHAVIPKPYFLVLRTYLVLLSKLQQGFRVFELQLHVPLYPHTMTAAPSFRHAEAGT